MTLALAILASAVVGAFANRHRGGWLPTGHTQIARLNFSVIVTALVLWHLAPFSWPLIPLLLAGFMFGCLAGQGEGMWMGLGTSPLWRDALDLFGSGLWNVAVPVAALWCFDAPHWYVLLIAGALKPVAYFIGNRVPCSVPHFDTGPELSEMFYGAVLGTACAAV